MSDFELDKEDLEKFKDWKKKQLNKNSSNCGMVGGRWTIMFTPTGIGTIISIKDNKLNEELDITDYDSW